MPLAVKASEVVLGSFISGGSLRDNFGFFTLYDKDELDDLSPKEKAVLKIILNQELEERK